MYKMSLVAGLVGMAMLIVFLGILIVWIKSVPLTIIMVGVIGLMIWDFINTMRQTNGNLR